MTNLMSLKAAILIKLVIYMDVEFVIPGTFIK